MKNCTNFSQSDSLVPDHPLSTEHLVLVPCGPLYSHDLVFFPTEVGVITLSSWTRDLKSRKVE